MRALSSPLHAITPAHYTSHSPAPTYQNDNQAHAARAQGRRGHDVANRRVATRLGWKAARQRWICSARSTMRPAKWSTLASAQRRSDWPSAEAAYGGLALVCPTFSITIGTLFCALPKKRPLKTNSPVANRRARSNESSNNSVLLRFRRFHRNLKVASRLWQPSRIDSAKRCASPALLC